jgi:hypothetical protein
MVMTDIMVYMPRPMYGMVWYIDMYGMVHMN